MQFYKNKGTSERLRANHVRDLREAYTAAGIGEGSVAKALSDENGMIAFFGKKRSKNIDNLLDRAGGLSKWNGGDIAL